MYAVMFVAALVNFLIFGAWILARRSTRKLRKRTAALRSEMERLLETQDLLLQSLHREMSKSEPGKSAGLPRIRAG